MKPISNLLQSIIDWHAAGKDAAIATLVQSSGSSPLPVGEMMAVSSALDMVGAVSRGCVESAILDTAQQVMQENKAVLSHFGYSDQSAFAVGLTCGGKIDVLVEPILRSERSDVFLRTILEISESDKPFFWLHIMNEDIPAENLLCDQDAVLYSDKTIKPAEKQVVLKQLALETPTSIMHLPLEGDQNTAVFVQTFQPARRLVIIGAGEIAIGLTPMAKLLGFKVIVIDPRSMFASPVRFPEADIVLAKWPQDCLEELNLHPRDHLVVISHDEKIDLPALQIGITSPVGYIGLLGSMKTRQSRFDALLETGLKTSDLARIHAPIGINIHSKKANEIAVSILAEIIQLSHQS